MLPKNIQSLWIATTSQTNYPELQVGLKRDVVIIGGGIAGLQAAYFLVQEGVKVTIIESSRIATGTSGNTTAKITSQHNLKYAFLKKHFGLKKARIYADSNQWAIKEIEKIPQFEKLPALFITAGEYEANFYLAQNGKLELKNHVKMPPREEAREKQAFVGKKGGMQSLSSVSHHGAYIENLKKKFQKKVHAIIHDMLAEYKLEEIYLFSPRYSARRIMDGLDKSEQKKVRMKFFYEYTKLNPLKMMEIFWQTEQEAIRPKIIPKNMAQRIIQQKVK